MTDDLVKRPVLRIYTEATSGNGGLWAFSPYKSVHTVFVEESNYRDLEDRIEALTALATEQQAQIERLRDALKPFADEAEHWESWVADEFLVEWFPEYDGNENPITVGDLRNARAALKGDRNE